MGEVFTKKSLDKGPIFIKKSLKEGLILKIEKSFKNQLCFWGKKKRKKKKKQHVKSAVFEWENP